MTVIACSKDTNMGLRSASNDSGRGVHRTVSRLATKNSATNNTNVVLTCGVTGGGFVSGNGGHVVLYSSNSFGMNISSTRKLRRLVRERQGDKIFLAMLKCKVNGCGSGGVRMLTRGKGNGRTCVSGLRRTGHILINRFNTALRAITGSIGLRIRFGPTRMRTCHLMNCRDHLLGSRSFGGSTGSTKSVNTKRAIATFCRIVPMKKGGACTKGISRLGCRGGRGIDIGPANSSRLLAIGLHCGTPSGSIDEGVRLPFISGGNGGMSSSFHFTSTMTVFKRLLQSSSFGNRTACSGMVDLTGRKLSRSSGKCEERFIHLIRTIGKVRRRGWVCPIDVDGFSI